MNGFKCPICSGEGRIQVTNDVPSIDGSILCPPCKGTGRVTLFGWFLMGFQRIKHEVRAR